MTWAMYDALADACDRVDADASIASSSCAPRGEAFVAGTDIRQFTAFQSGDDGIAYERRMEAVIDRLERLPVPTIAQVHGVAAGGGCVIALVCDLRVCTPTAQIRRSDRAHARQLPLGRELRAARRSRSDRRAPRICSSPAASSTSPKRTRWAW